MARSLARSIGVFLLIVLLVAAGGLVVDELLHLGYPEQATVTVSNESGDLGTLDVRVAASLRERFVGLSWTDSLGENEGMLFVHDSPGRKTYVMRGMAFSIDVVFVAPNGTITAIHHLSADGTGPTRASGYAKWVIEAPRGWTTNHGIDVGDTVHVDWPDD